MLKAFLPLILIILVLALLLFSALFIPRLSELNAQPTRVDQDMDKYIAKIVEAQVLVTRDGGQSWQISFTGPEKGKDFVAVDCPNSKFCFLVMIEARFFVTTDQGQSWTEKKAPGGFLGNEFTRISCPDATTCYLMSDREVFVTRDSGTTWANVTPPEYRNIPYPGKLRGFDCRDTQNCVMSNLAGEVAVTTDGAATWHITGPKDNSQLTSVECILYETCIVGGSYAGTAITLTTNDNGQTWNINQVGISQSISNLSCPTTNKCFAAGVSRPAKGETYGKSLLLSSLDRGVSWRGLIPDKAYPARDLTCPAENNCLSEALDYEISVTQDAGLHWTNFKTNQGREIKMVKCISTEICFVLASSSQYPSSSGWLKDSSL